jgi:ferredoxin
MVSKVMGSCSSDGKHLTPRVSRAGRWRAIVLILVHVAIALHIGHYMATGKTVSPLEPSESMAFTGDGLINAGVIFFALTIASTLVLGRWFCGWACHVVALQDLCRHWMVKIGIRPRHVDLGVLKLVPWMAFVYMFPMPLVLTWLDGKSFSISAVALTTDSFWRTFPGWEVALLTFFVCGFAIVYLLGGKAFCSYGCPYGGIFGIADQLAPLRIRVTDACSQCGHCTVACTSNVNVSREVREYGMVVDPGCMKCLDCVQVCPKDALYVGWGAPSLFAKARTALHERSRSWIREILTLLFLFGGYMALTLHNGLSGALLNEPQWKLAAILAAGSWLVAFVFRPKSAARSDHLPLEECALGVLFLAALISFRGLHGWVPLLMAMGVAAIAAWMAVQGCRLIARRDFSWRNWRLKREGFFTDAGAAFGVLVLASVVGWAFAAREQRTLVREFRTKEAALTACSNGDFTRGLGLLEELIAESPDDAELLVYAGQACLYLQQNERARGHLEAAIRADPLSAPAHRLLAALADMEGKADEAARHREAAERGRDP